MNRVILRRLLEYPLWFLAGGLLAFAMMAASFGRKSGDESGTRSRSQRAAASPFSALDFRSRESRAMAYQRDWQELLARPMAESERRAQAIKLLEKWAEVDLKAALAAAIDANKQGWDKVPLTLDLMGAFDREISRNPQTFAELIRRGDFGMDSTAIRSRWLGVAARRDPISVIANLDLVPLSRRDAAMTEVIRGLRRNPEQAADVRRLIEGLPDTPGNRRVKARLPEIE